MSQETWSTVDAYIDNLLVGADPVLEDVLRESAAAGLPPINVTPSQGKLLYVLACMQGARRILEIGALGGYSTIWLARALPETGLLMTLEANPYHARVAEANIARAGLSATVDIRVGRALDLLSSLSQDRVAPFDLIFIDADKANIPQYLEWSLKLSRPGTSIVIDNVVQNGRVADPSSTDRSVLGVRDALELIASNPCLTATVIQKVGSKGYDGLALALVTSACAT
jgi:predicted O-methyltransferase YrrM